MYFRTFFFLLFITSSGLFFLATLKPELTLNLCGSICHHESSLNYIQLTSIITSSITVILLAISNYFTEKRVLEEKKRAERDRLNIEQIHAELEALKQ